MGLKSNLCVLKKKDTEIQRHIKDNHVKTGRNWSDAAKSQKNTPEARKRQGGILLWSLQRDHGPADPSQTSSIQNCEKINFCRFKAPSHDNLSQQPQETNTPPEIIRNLSATHHLYKLLSFLKLSSIQLNKHLCRACLVPVTAHYVLPYFLGLWKRHSQLLTPWCFQSREKKAGGLTGSDKK